MHGCRACIHIHLCQGLTYTCNAFDTELCNGKRGMLKMATKTIENAAMYFTTT